MYRYIIKNVILYNVLKLVSLVKYVENTHTHIHTYVRKTESEDGETLQSITKINKHTFAVVAYKIMCFLRSR